MILLYIYLAISVLCLIMYGLAIIVITKKIEIRYGKVKYEETFLSARILHVIKLVLACFMPLMNIGLLWVITFKYSDFETRVLNKLCIEFIKE